MSDIEASTDAPVLDDERYRREMWRRGLDALVAEVGGRRPEAWQLDLAAWLLARRPRRTVTGGGDIWCTAQVTASDLVKEMKADGRLNEWGNWPESVFPRTGSWTTNEPPPFALTDGAPSWGAGDVLWKRPRDE